MDQYQNPEAFTAFKVKGDPWTFVIDEHQVVRFRQPGRMLYGELDHAITSVLKLDAKETKADEAAAVKAAKAAKAVKASDPSEARAAPQETTSS